MPGIQIYVIRILVICPVYAISSSLALALGNNGAYAEIARDVYEAFVIYSFLNLILEYSGGETDCMYQIENEPQLHMPCPLCFLKPRPRDARFSLFYSFYSFFLILLFFTLFISFLLFKSTLFIISLSVFSFSLCFFKD